MTDNGIHVGDDSQAHLRALSAESDDSHFSCKRREMRTMIRDVRRASVVRSQKNEVNAKEDEYTHARRTSVLRMYSHQCDHIVRGGANAMAAVIKEREAEMDPNIQLF